MIEITDVRVVHPGAERPALDGVSITVAPGETVALMGPNGSGKSTLGRLCNGLMRPSAGRVAVDGLDTTDDHGMMEVRRRVGLVQQNPENQIVGTVVEEDVAFGPENLGVPAPELRRRVDEAIAAVGLTGLERREPHLLSEGQKQRLAIAGALAIGPDYLVLDEPTAMLDPVGREDVRRALDRLHDQGVGMLHITHRLDEAVSADRLVVLSAGRIVFDGHPGEILESEGLARTLAIEVPPVGVLAELLRRGGVPVPARSLQPDVIAESLWR